MPPRGVKSSKRARQYEHIKDSAQKQGRSTRRAKQIAAATVNKQRREAGETRSSAGGRKSPSKGRTKTAKGSSVKTAKGGASRSRKSGGSTRKAASKKR
jgi:hypothetical protein